MRLGGLYGRPRPVPLARILGTPDNCPTRRATIKALPTPRRPPSPLRITQLPPGFPPSVGCVFDAFVGVMVWLLSWLWIRKGAAFYSVGAGADVDVGLGRLRRPPGITLNTT